MGLSDAAHEIRKRTQAIGAAVEKKVEPITRRVEPVAHSARQVAETVSRGAQQVQEKAAKDYRSSPPPRFARSRGTPRAPARQARSAPAARPISGHGSVFGIGQGPLNLSQGSNPVAPGRGSVIDYRGMNGSAIEVSRGSAVDYGNGGTALDFSSGNILNTSAGNIDYRKGIFRR